MSMRQNSANIRSLFSDTVSTNYNGGMTPPTANLWGWWNAENAYSDAGSTLITTDGTTCQQMTDLSGNGRHLTGTGAQKPTWYSDKLNGRPTLLGNGSGNYLSAVTSPFPTDFSIYMVIKQVSWTASDIIISDFGVNVDLIQQGSSPTIGLGSVTSLRNTNADLNTYHLIQAIYNTGGGMSYNIIDSVITSGSVVGTSRGNGVYLFGDSGNQANVEIAEVLIYNTIHSPTEQDDVQVKQYLNTKYGLRIFPGDIGFNNSYTLDTSAELPVSSSVIFDGTDYTYVDSTYCPTSQTMFFSKYRGLSAGNEAVVFSPISQSIVSRIAVGFTAQQITYNLHGNKVYIGCTDAGTYQSINPQTNAIITDLGNFGAIAAYCPSNGYHYVIKNTSPVVDATIRVIHPLTNATVTSVVYSGVTLYGACYCPSNDCLYVTDASDNFYTINCTSNTKLDTINVPSMVSCTRIIYVPTVDRLYATGGTDTNVYVINPYTNEVKVLTFGPSYQASICYNPKRDLIYIGAQSNKVYILDPHTNIIIKTVEVDANSLTYCPVNGMVYATMTKGFTYLT